MVEKVIKSIQINEHKKGVNVFDVPSNTFIRKLAEHFKEKNLIKLPSVRDFLLKILIFFSFFTTKINFCFNTIFYEYYFFYNKITITYIKIIILS